MASGPWIIRAVGCSVVCTTGDKLKSQPTLIIVIITTTMAATIIIVLSFMMIILPYGNPISPKETWGCRSCIAL
jgi:hypothetical protein